MKKKLNENIEIFNSQILPFHLKKVEVVKTNKVCERLINWVSGEFDLYLKTESESEFLIVYFPSGWFTIRNICAKNNKEHIEIKVEGKSRIMCQKIVSKIETIYNHVLLFSEERMEQNA